MSVILFASIGKKIDEVILKAVTALQGQTATVALSILVGSYTLYILWHGYMTLAGKIQEPINELIWNLARLLLVYAFVSNLGGYLDLSINAIEGLKTALSGQVDPLILLDQVTEDQLTSIFKLWDSIDPGLNVAQGLLLVLTCFICIVSLILFLVPAFIVLVLNTVALKLLLVTAPLFIFCLSYGFLRSMFNNWLTLIFSNILTLMFISAFVVMFNGIFDEALLKSNENVYASLFLISVSYIVMGVVSGKILQLCVSLGSQLAGASVESASAAATAHRMTGNASKTALAKTGGAVATVATKGFSKVTGSLQQSLGSYLGKRK